MNLPKILTSTTKIRFQDCDPFNHLNNGKYTDYFMNHREDAVAEVYDLDIFKMAKTEARSWVSSTNQIAYLKPALLMETVHIESELIACDSSNLMVEMRMYNISKTELKSILWASFTHVNLLTKKRENHSKKLSDLFSNIVVPKKINTFEERVKALKSN